MRIGIKYLIIHNRLIICKFRTAICRCVEGIRTREIGLRAAFTFYFSVVVVQIPSAPSKAEWLRCMVCAQLGLYGTSGRKRRRTGKGMVNEKHWARI